MKPVKLWITGCIAICVMGTLFGIISRRMLNDIDFWKDSAEYNRKQAHEWKHRAELLEDAFGIGTRINPSEGL